MQKKRKAVLEYHSQIPPLLGISGVEQMKAGNFLPDIEYYWVQDLKTFRSLKEINDIGYYDASNSQTAHGHR